MVGVAKNNVAVLQMTTTQETWQWKQSKEEKDDYLNFDRNALNEIKNALLQKKESVKVTIAGKGAVVVNLNDLKWYYENNPLNKKPIRKITITEPLPSAANALADNAPAVHQSTLQPSTLQPISAVVAQTLTNVKKKKKVAFAPATAAPANATAAPANATAAPANATAAPANATAAPANATAAFTTKKRRPKKTKEEKATEKAADEAADEAADKKKETEESFVPSHADNNGADDNGAHDNGARPQIDKGDKVALRKFFYFEPKATLTKKIDGYDLQAPILKEFEFSKQNLVRAKLDYLFDLIDEKTTASIFAEANDFFTKMSKVKNDNDSILNQHKYKGTDKTKYASNLADKEQVLENLIKINNNSIKERQVAAEELRNFKYHVQEVDMTNGKGKLIQYVTLPVCLRDPVSLPLRPRPSPLPRSDVMTKRTPQLTPATATASDLAPDFTARTPDFTARTPEPAPALTSAPAPPPCKIKRHGYAEITKDFLSENQELYKAGLIGFVKAFDGSDLILKFKDGTFIVIDQSYVCNVEKPIDWDDTK